MQGIATALLAPCWPASRAWAAGLGFAWVVVPTIAMVGAADDPRQALVRDAVELGKDWSLSKAVALTS
jgi:hypothetical protein